MTWRIDRIPSKRVSVTDDNRVRLPLWILRDGRHAADAPLTLSRVEAEHLHAEPHCRGR
ncbi:hypothetical protein [Streptomyces boncukensis]|uniref:Uncharacterized protein n=1 Tax=Streptomyces boncukensis TaxID=2711219 RepID=A0A6G4WZL7_9ACTN|nr:hypothetical protein [Streptomyces boncukensis]NGO70739.1 hypothetical protein [Streptomyces boncukensis]